MASTRTSGTDSTQSHQKETLSEINLIIHHQFPDIKLASPVYLCHNATHRPSFDKQVNSGHTMKANLKLNLSRKGISALMYKLQGKNTASEKDNETCVQLVIIWKIDSSKEISVISDLMEHEKDRIWYRYKLQKLVEYYKLFDIQHCPIEETYLLHDNTVLMTTLNASHKEGCYEIEMTISKTSINDNTTRIRYIELDR
jgi:hypothetical protein